MVIFRKNHARAMDSIQASLESEQRAKTEALRIKKKLEGDINELEIAVDQANKANSEAGKAIKRYQGQLRDAEVSCSEEAKTRAEIITLEEQLRQTMPGGALPAPADPAAGIIDPRTIQLTADDL